jgi:hypothetical protein
VLPSIGWSDVRRLASLWDKDSCLLVSLSHTRADADTKSHFPNVRRAGIAFNHQHFFFTTYFHKNCFNVCLPFPSVSNIFTGTEISVPHKLPLQNPVQNPSLNIRHVKTKGILVENFARTLEYTCEGATGHGHVLAPCLFVIYGCTKYKSTVNINNLVNMT